MIKKSFVSILVLFIVCVVGISAFADTKTVHLGETGITCQVDSAYDIITSSNKQDYSQQIQSLVPQDNIVLCYSLEKGLFLVYYDQGKDFEPYDFSDKKSEEIVANYKDYVGLDLSSFGFSNDSDVSVYDSGKAKWLKLSLMSGNYIFYCTIQGNKSASLMVYPQTFKNIKDIENVIDSFNFGNPSLWDKIKSIAGKITDFGKSILGIPGAIIIWIIVGPTILGIVGYLLAIIIAIIGSIFTKKK